MKKNVGARRDRDASLALFGVKTKQAVLLWFQPSFPQNVVFLLGRPKSRISTPPIVFAANTIRVLSLRNVFPFSAVFLLSKANLVLSLFLRLEDDDSAVAFPTSPCWDSGTWQRQRSATVIIGVFEQGCGMFFPGQYLEEGSVPVLKTQFSGKPRRSLQKDVLSDVGKVPAV